VTDKKINEAKRLAVEFVASVEKMRACEKVNANYPSGKHRAEVRRRSMDLTRALADMRRPTYE